MSEAKDETKKQKRVGFVHENRREEEMEKRREMEKCRWDDPVIAASAVSNTMSVVPFAQLVLF